MDIFTEYSQIINQLLVLSILGVSLVISVTDRWRFDVVALLVMLAIIAVGILPYQDVLANFGHPVVIIVVSMFVLSNALVHSGIVDLIITRLSWLHHRPVAALLSLMVLVTVISAFINSVGALAITIPIALYLARKSQTPTAFFLLPLAFASHLGSYLTLIGSPRNILISTFRTDAVGTGFAMFDFATVGIFLSVAGLISIAIYAFFFLPRKSTASTQPLRSYVTEATITDESKHVTEWTVSEFEDATKHNLRVLSIFRDDIFLPATSHTRFVENDILLLQGTEESLTQYIQKYRMTLAGLRSIEKHVTNQDEYVTIEALIPPYAALNGTTWNQIPLPDRFGTNFIGLTRSNHTPRQHLADIYLHGNDILLLEGRAQSVESTMNTLGLMPLAGSNAHLGQPTSVFATLSIIVAAIIVASFNVLPLSVIFLSAVFVLIIFNLISLPTLYKSIEWPVVVLVAGMITLGEALQTSGAADSFANAILHSSNLLGPAALLGITLLATMLMADFINSTVATVTMAPIGITLATSLGASIDPFLMAVAVGSASAFLTPTGYESNAFVMQKGGYKFTDFTKLGLPLEIIIFCISLPLILHFWPLF